jgi:hypothetical protein
METERAAHEAYSYQAIYPDRSWRLTNSVGLAAANHWFDYPGSTSVTNVSITISTHASDVFFRMVYP